MDGTHRLTQAMQFAQALAYGLKVLADSLAETRERDRLLMRAVKQPGPKSFQCASYLSLG